MYDFKVIILESFIIYIKISDFLQLLLINSEQLFLSFPDTFYDH